MWKRSIARVLTRDGVVCGAGFLVMPDLVMTCAHVIDDACGGSKVEGRMGERVTLDFPFAGVFGVMGSVVYWAKALSETERKADEPSDVAILKLEDFERLSAVRPRLIAKEPLRPETPLLGCGFPAGYVNGVDAYGYVRNIDAGGWIAVTARGDHGYFFEPGFSGAPVLAQMDKGEAFGPALGMVATSDRVRERGLAHLIPPPLLLKALREVAKPYRWLEAFREGDADFFFGREKFLEKLIVELNKSRFLALVGVSGSGKSSLLRAGIVAWHREQGWDARVVRPGANVLAALANAVKGKEIEAS